MWLDGEMVGSGSCIPQRKGDWSPDHTSYPRNDCLESQVVIGWKWTREMSKEQWGIPSGQKLGISPAQVGQLAIFWYRI